MLTRTSPHSQSADKPGQLTAAKLNGVATIDFHITAKCSQACPYCWGPRRFRSPVNTETATQIIARIRDLGVRRIVFTGGDPLQRQDAPELVAYADQIGLETALSTTGDLLTQEILEKLVPHLDLVSLPLDGSTDAINSRTKHPGHYAAVLRSLELLKAYPSIDVKVCTPVTQFNLFNIPAIADLVAAYSRTTQARVFYNVFQAFPRAMFSARWDRLLVSDTEFSELKELIGPSSGVRINFLDHRTLDKLYVMIFPDGRMTIPRGGEYLNFGPFLEVGDFEQAIRSSEFDTVKHLNHARGWASSSSAVDPDRAVLRYKNEQ